MSTYQNPLWGFELTYPDNWVHNTIDDTEGFAKTPQALESNYEGPESGHLLLRAELNWARQPIEPLWKQHIGKLSVMLGSKKVGSAPWFMGGGTGFEAEILLPKKAQRRLWAGVLAHGVKVLHFMVAHSIEDRSWFEPVVTDILSSLRFLSQVPHLQENADGLPLPPDYSPTDPTDLIDDIDQPQHWQAYQGNGQISALQAFYLREAPIHGWEIEEYVPFPGPSKLNFARLKLKKGEKNLTLGILPAAKKGLGDLVIKRN